jgi:DNA-binding MarR family transcriptional regulator
MLALLTKRGLLSAMPLPQDGRRTQLRVTDEGQRMLDAVQPIVLDNRAVALAGISEDDLVILRQLLERIAANCAPSNAPAARAGQVASSGAEQISALG